MNKAQGLIGLLSLASTSITSPIQIQDNPTQNLLNYNSSYQSQYQTKEDEEYQGKQQVGLLIWAKLRLVTSIPRSTYC